MTEIETNATRELDQLGVRYEAQVHDRPVHSLEQAAAARGLDPEQIVRTLLFRLEDGSFVLVLMPGPGKVNWSKLRAHLEVSRVTTARPEEVLEVTGYPPGAVSPFGLQQPLRILADARLAEHEQVSVGAGVKDAGLLLSSRALLQALDPELVDLKSEG